MLFLVLGLRLSPEHLKNDVKLQLPLGHLSASVRCRGKVKAICHLPPAPHPHSFLAPPLGKDLAPRL